MLVLVLLNGAPRLATFGACCLCSCEGFVEFFTVCQAESSRFNRKSFGDGGVRSDEPIFFRADHTLIIGITRKQNSPRRSAHRPPALTLALRLRRARAHAPGLNRRATLQTRRRPSRAPTLRAPDEALKPAARCPAFRSAIKGTRARRAAAAKSKKQPSAPTPPVATPASPHIRLRATTAAKHRSHHQRLQSRAGAPPSPIFSSIETPLAHARP